MVNHDNDEIWHKLIELDSKLTELGTNQRWIRENITEIQTTAIRSLKETTEQIKDLAKNANDEVKVLGNRVTKLEQVSWYQKGFYAGMGAAISLAAILIPNIGKLF